MIFHTLHAESVDTFRSPVGARVDSPEDLDQAPALTLARRPQSLTDVVYETIHAAIVNKAIQPGEALSEPGMAKRLGVSKTPVREAFLRLRQSGLLEPDGQRGLRLVRFSVETLRSAYEVREALEPFIAARCAEHADAATRQEISRAASDSLERANAGDQDGFRTSDAAFHAAIASTMSNPRITEPLDAARDLIGALRARDLPHAQAAVACGEDHVRIAAAIERGDAETAAAEMGGHVAKVRDLILAAAVPES
jgi:DNA-binding GntR family transcriptional regulator